MAIDVFAEMDQEIEVVKAKSAASNSNVFFFGLKDGERAMVRFLLDLRECVSVYKHELFNVSANKYDVSALCARSLDLEPEQCQHCQDVASNKKLEAIKYFIVPVFVYGIKDKFDKPVTYTDKDGNTHPTSGVRLMQMKATAPLLASLRENYRELEQGDSFLNHDIKISVAWQNGDRKKPSYTVILKPSRTAFKAPDGVEVPAQSRDKILESLNEVWKPALVNQPGNTSAATSNDFDPFADSDNPSFPLDF